MTSADSSRTADRPSSSRRRYSAKSTARYPRGSPAALRAICNMASSCVKYSSNDGAVNRRQIAREFGVSPQSVARILDGPETRRGHSQAGPTPPTRPHIERWFAVGAVVWLALVVRRRTR